MREPASDPAAPTGPTDVFEVLGNETRLRIVQVLAADRRVNWRRDGRGFAELRRSVGVRDAGTFNYHLDRLRDRFVVEEDGEYVLTAPGLEVADAILSGTFDPGGFDVDRVAETGTPCPSCSTPLRVRYGRGRCAVVCPEHGEFVADTVPPTAAAGRDGEALLRVLSRDIQQELEDARDGVCFHCAGRMRAHLQPDAPLRNPVTGDPVDDGDANVDVAGEAVLAVLGCERCETVFWSRPRWLVLRHPAVVAAFYEQGVDVRDRSFLDPAVRAATSDPERLDDDPCRLRLTFACEHATAELVVDETATVVDSSLTRT
jgi:DNA-binding transcriptional ArsR family regulator